MNRARRKVLQQIIDEELAKQERNRVIQIANNIKKEKGFDANAYWEFDKRMKKRNAEVATAMMDEKGNLEEDPGKIREIYKTFYQKLLKDREPENEEEKEIQQLKEKCIQVMIKNAENKEIKEITTEEYGRMKSKIKRKKAPDEEGWRYEWIENAGKDMEESIILMMNESRKNKIQPEQWSNMRIKSTTKKPKKRMDMNYKRGLFMTNILSKCMERIFLNRHKEKLDQSMQPFQNGGVKERSIADVSFILNNTIAEFKKQNKDLYILFGDLEKCFDKLYLKDCIIELVEAGMPIEEAIYIYNMNRNIEAVVDTPHGNTEKFMIEEAVRQGTIFGPTLCGVSTNRINKMGQEEPLMLHETIEIGCPIFIDDMSGMGSRKRIENVGGKMAGLEVTKKFVFNNEMDKTEYMIMENSKEGKEEVKIKVRKGEIGETEKYKCLGDYYDKKSDNEIKITKKMEKAKFMAYETKRKGAYSQVGRANMSVQLLLLETTLKPTLLSNTETWCNITKKEESQITSHHHKILCVIFGVPKSTPYYGIVGETAIWPYKYVILYKKLMFLHHLIHSNDERLAKRIVMRQEYMMENENNYDTWFAELSRRMESMEININTNLVAETTKSAWKKEAKEKIEKEISRELQENALTMSKLRFQRGKVWGRMEYVDKCDMETVGKIMNIRLNMVDCKSNFKGNYEDVKCVMCDEVETTEHLLVCEYYKQFTGATEITNQLELESTNELVKAAQKMDIIQEIRRQHVSV